MKPMKPVMNMNRLILKGNVTNACYFINAYSVQLHICLLLTSTITHTKSTFLWSYQLIGIIIF